MEAVAPELAEPPIAMEEENTMLKGMLDRALSRVESDAGALATLELRAAAAEAGAEDVRRTCAGAMLQAAYDATAARQAALIAPPASPGPVARVLRVRAALASDDVARMACEVAIARAMADDAASREHRAALAAGRQVESLAAALARRTAEAAGARAEAAALTAAAEIHGHPPLNPSRSPRSTRLEAELDEARRQLAAKSAKLAAYESEGGGTGTGTGGRGGGITRAVTVSRHTDSLPVAAVPSPRAPPLAPPAPALAIPPPKPKVKAVPKAKTVVATAPPPPVAPAVVDLSRPYDPPTDGGADDDDDWATAPAKPAVKAKAKPRNSNAVSEPLVKAPPVAATRTAPVDHFDYDYEGRGEGAAPQPAPSPVSAVVGRPPLGPAVTNTVGAGAAAGPKKRKLLQAKPGGAFADTLPAALLFGGGGFAFPKLKK